ncbi:MAG: hypothetical protein LBC70_08170 [Chitinispirillales bacterium]|jgi:uncharacterized protein (TIGR02145 family)/uncharacterized repeat protein (TIGR02543 family)|nr:hypothetical protein [Chitinispirillales bacterium]
MVNFKKKSCKLSGWLCVITAIFFACEKIPEHCGDGNSLNHETQFCFNDRTYDKCGGNEYDPINQRCEGNIVKTKCGDAYFDPINERCVGNVVHSRCGDGTFVPPGTLCATYTLTANAVPGDGGSINRDPHGLIYNAGTSVTVTATAASGYMFTGWSGVSTSTMPSIAIIMDRDQVLTANFERRATPLPVYTLFAVNRNPTDGGTAFVNNVQSTFATTHDSGAVINIRASAAGGYTFVSWALTSGTAILANANDTTTTLILNSNTTLTANFALAAPPLLGDTLVDGRDGKRYRTVKIGNLTWMAENLNYTTSGSLCYANNISYCAIYGRLYTWDAAMTACPPSWRLPTRHDWDYLISAVDGRLGFNAGTKLRTTTGWECNNPNGCVVGTDEFGFSAMPGGHCLSSGIICGEIGIRATWWTADEYDDDRSWYSSMSSNTSFLIEIDALKRFEYSVRCVR